LIQFQALYLAITVERHEMNTAQQIAAQKKQHRLGPSRLIEQGLEVVTGAIYPFTSFRQTIKYRLINDMEPMSVQMSSRLKERDSLIFDFVEMVTGEAYRVAP
jgi:hypothetical protein